MASENVLKDLNLSNDEVKRLGEALKDETFRKMLVEYAEEISDPENRRKAEEEIAMMESERGMNVEFIHPEPGYVMKTTVDGSRKAFINICQNAKIEKPKAKRGTGPDGKSGLMWQIPHSFAPPKDDIDKAQQTCRVFDVVFHPDTFRMAKTNERFRKLVEDTAVEGIETQFSVKLDKKNIKYPKMKFKGVPMATIIRERKTDDEKSSLDPDNILNQMPYPYDSKTSSEKAKENEKKQQNNKKEVNGKSTAAKKEEDKFTVPKYVLTHRSELDMSEYRNAPDAKTSTRPTELIVKIDLPLLKSAAQASLDIFEKRLVLESVSPAAYKLDLALPYPVNEDDGTAKFDKVKRTLTVTLPVIPDKTPIPKIGENSAPTDQEIVSDSLTNDSSPLIQVLSEDTNEDTRKAKENGVSYELERKDVGNREEKIAVIDNETKASFPQNVKWVLPEHQFSQDNETVSFILKVQNVEDKWIQTFFPQNTVAMIQFMSLGSGCFPVYYSLYVEFPDGCTVSAEHCSVDRSHDNLVFLILKDKNARGLWDSFKIGIDDTQLEEKQFLTECNLQRELAALDSEQDNTDTMPGQAMDTSVVEMNEKKLIIDIKPAKPRAKNQDNNADKEEDEDEEYDPPSSADIQVVHKHPIPNLHSILKSRTVSESSEDIVSDPSSPRTNGEEEESLQSSFSKRRSVSFNSYVDKASFKSSAAPSSMTPALKSKRRRQRKHEQKVLNSRNRKNSSGNSSSEECLMVSDSMSHSEEETESTQSKGKRSKGNLSRAVSDPGPSTIDDVEMECGPERTSDVAIDEKPGKQLSENEKDEATTSTTSVQNGLDFRTNTNGDSVNGDGSSSESVSKEEERKKKIVSDIKNKLAENGTNGGPGGDAEGKPMEDDSDDDNFEDAVSSISEDLSSKVNVGSKGASGDDGLSQKSEVETMLSWEEGLQDQSNEHSTQCAFQFSNSIIFDLDVD